MKHMLTVFRESTNSLQEQIHALKQEQAKGADIQQLKESLQKLEDTVKSMGDFQLVRIPKQP